MRALKCALLLLSSVTVFSACGDGADTSPRLASSPRTEPTPAYVQFDLPRRDADYAIVFDALVGNTRGDLLWRKRDYLERWDMFLVSPRTGGLSGDTTFLSGGRESGGCRWSFKEGASVEIRCANSGLVIPADQLFYEGLAILEPSFVYLEDRVFLERETSCFRTSSKLDSLGSAEICLTPDGIPLFLEIQYSIWGPARLEATRILDLPAPDELAELPWDLAKGDPPPLVTRKDVRYPPIPSLLEFLETGIAPVFDKGPRPGT
jgi:hypothetical protein